MKVRNSGLNQFKQAKIAQCILLSLGLLAPGLVVAQETTEDEEEVVETSLQ